MRGASGLTVIPACRAQRRTRGMDEDGWKLPMEEWAAPGGGGPRGHFPDEDLRAVDGFMYGQGGMSMEQMMHYRMGEYGAVRREDRGGRSRGHAAANGGAPYPGGGDKDEMGRPAGEMRSMHDGLAHGKLTSILLQLRAPAAPTLTAHLPAGLGMQQQQQQQQQAPNLASSLPNTQLGNYLTVCVQLPPPRLTAQAAKRSGLSLMSRPAMTLVSP